MKKSIRVAILTVVLASFLAEAEVPRDLADALLSYEKVPVYFDRLSNQGLLQLSVNLEMIPLVSSFKVPFGFIYTSSFNRSSLFGLGWKCPLLESKAFKISEDLLRIELPNGMVAVLRRDQGGLEEFESSDGSIKAAQEGRDLHVTLGAVILNYSLGALREIVIGPRHFTFNVAPDSISIDNGVDKILTATRAVGTGLVDKVTIMSGSVYTVSYGSFPIMAPVDVRGGEPIVSGLDPGISSVAAKGKVLFSLSVEQMAQDGIVLNYTEGETLASQPAKLKISPSGQLISDDSFFYSFSKKGDTNEYVRIDRISRKKDSFVVNAKTGESILNFANGCRITSRLFTSGSLALRPRDALVESNGQSIGSSKYDYDENGKLIRIVNMNSLKNITVTKEQDAPPSEKTVGKSNVILGLEREFLDWLKAKQSMNATELRSTSDALIKEVEQKLGRTSEEPAGLLLIGDIYLYSNRAIDAISCYEKALATNGNLPNVRNKLVAAFISSNLSGDGINYFRQRERLEQSNVNPEMHVALVELLDCRASSGADIKDESLVVSQAAGKDNIQDVIETFRILLKHRLTAAENQYCDFLERRPLLKQTASYCRALLMAASDGKSEEAVARFEDVVSNSDNSLPLKYRAFALNYIAYKGSESATPDGRLRCLKLIGEALAIDPNNPDYLDTQGWILYQSGDLEGASLRFNMALQQSPLNNATIKCHLAEVMRALGKYDEARRLLIEVLKDDENNKDAKAILEKLPVQE